MFKRKEIVKDSANGKIEIIGAGPAYMMMNSGTIDCLGSNCKLPIDPKERKALPIVTGVLDYFPDAIAAVADLSRVGNEQHNPGQPLHWDKTKSTDHADCIGRHLIDRGKLDSDGVRHSAKIAWRALALLQTEIEAENAEVNEL